MNNDYENPSSGNANNGFPPHEQSQTEPTAFHAPDPDASAAGSDPVGSGVPTPNSAQGFHGAQGFHSAPTTSSGAPGFHRDPALQNPMTPNGAGFKKKRAGGGMVALVLFLSVLLSLGAGFGAGYSAFLYYGGAGASGNNASNRSGSSYNPTVLYQNISADVGTVEDGSIESVVSAVANSVVEITTESVSTGSYFGQYVQQGAGSGVIVSTDGYIATNNHVVEGAKTITVRLKNGTEYTAKLIGADADSDLAVIKIDATELTPVIFGDSAKLGVGQTVIAIGNPLGSLGGTVTDGIISALDREITIDGKKMMLLQTSTAVNPGNSGGGLFNLKGELIGIVNAKSSGESVEGLGFAIPSSNAYATIGELIEFGYVRGRVSLGLNLIDIDNSMTAAYYRVNNFGCYIISSEYSDELKQGDRITAVNGTAVTYYEDIATLKSDMKVGDTITITVVRDNKVIDIPLVCQEKTADETDIDFET